MRKSMLISACAALLLSACTRNEIPPDVTPEQIMTTASETIRETETEIAAEEEITEVITSVSAEPEPAEGYIDYTDMPEPFHPNAAEGGECILYYSLTDHILAGFPLGLMHAAGYEDFSEFERWVDEMNEKSSGISTSISESTNVFTFIRDHEFDEDKLRELLLSLFEHYNTHLGGSYTDEDAEALINSDEKAVTEKFINPYAVFYNGKIYTPHWLYVKDTVQYEIEKIPPVLIIEKYDEIMELPFEEEAKETFTEKIRSYCGGLAREEIVTDLSMPEPFGAGCVRPFFHLTCVEKFDYLGAPFDEYAMENNLDLYSYGELAMKQIRLDTSIETESNIYTFMTYFNVSDEDMRMLMKKCDGMYGMSDEPVVYTDEEIEIILSRDIKAITDYFASPYSIVVGEKIYSPEWVYFHTAEDYEAAGIAPEMLAEKAELYSDAGFEQEAKEAFENKLSDYIGYEVDLTYTE